jgi:hypothetical protein
MLDQAGDVFHMADNMPHGRAGACRERRAQLDTLQRIADQILDFACRARAPMRKRTDLLGHDRETAPVATRAGCLDRRIQREEVSLERDAIMSPIRCTA